MTIIFCGVAVRKDSRSLAIVGQLLGDHDFSRTPSLVVAAGPCDSRFLPHGTELLGNLRSLNLGYFPSRLSMSRRSNEVSRLIPPEDRAMLLQMRLRQRLKGQLPLRHEIAARILPRSWVDRHLRFWDHLLRVRSVDRVIFFGVPHQVGDYALYVIARSRAISTLLIHEEKRGFQDDLSLVAAVQGTRERSSDENRLFIATSLDDIGRWELLQNAASLRSASSPDSPLQSASRSSRPSAVESVTRQWQDGSWRQRLALLRARHDLLTRLVRIRFYRMALEALSRRHASNGTRTKTILLLLPVQPEESTIPRSRLLWSMSSCIHEILRAIPSDWTLRIREHPHQIARLRPRSIAFMLQLATQRKLIIVPPTETFSDSISSADVIVSPSGSGLIQAWRLGKLVVSTSRSWLHGAPGVVAVGTLEELRCAIIRLTFGTEDHQPSSVAERQAYESRIWDLPVHLAYERTGNSDVEMIRLCEIVHRWRQS